MLSDYLSKEERFSCIKLGALSYAGMLDAENGPVPNTKSAGFMDAAKDSADAAKSIALLAALGAGVPLGVLSHVMGRRISGKRLKEEELKAKIEMYRNAADEMASGLAGGNA